MRCLLKLAAFMATLALGMFLERSFQLASLADQSN